jgi:hypothetical protein
VKNEDTARMRELMPVNLFAVFNERRETCRPLQRINALSASPA